MDENIQAAIVLVLEGGKYTVKRSNNGRMWADRYGEYWRDLTGDKLFGAMLDRLLDSEAHLREAGRR